MNVMLDNVGAPVRVSTPLATLVDGVAMSGVMMKNVWTRMIVSKTMAIGVPIPLIISMGPTL